MYTFSITGILYVDIIFYARRSQASHELRRSESKKAKLGELSNNISEKRCELKANEPVSERSERVSAYTLGFATERAQRS